MAASNKRIKKILAAIDLSIYSKNTLEYANEVSQTTGAELMIINIINLKEIDLTKKIIASKYPDDFSLETYFPGKINLRRLRIKALMIECGFVERPTIKIIINHGIPFQEILRGIEEEEADLLVIGQKGRTNLQEFLFGSVAEKLFRHSPVPVMSLRTRSEYNTT